MIPLGLGAATPTAKRFRFGGRQPQVEWGDDGDTQRYRVTFAFDKLYSILTDGMCVIGTTVNVMRAKSY